MRKSNLVNTFTVCVRAIKIGIEQILWIITKIPYFFPSDSYVRSSGVSRWDDFAVDKTVLFFFLVRHPHIHSPMKLSILLMTTD